jgi:hypothetical protein
VSETFDVIDGQISTYETLDVTYEFEAVDNSRGNSRKNLAAIYLSGLPSSFHWKLASFLYSDPLREVYCSVCIM